MTTTRITYREKHNNNGLYLKVHEVEKSGIIVLLCECTWKNLCGSRIVWKWTFYASGLYFHVCRYNIKRNTIPFSVHTKNIVKFKWHPFWTLKVVYSSCFEGWSSLSDWSYICYCSISMFIVLEVIDLRHIAFNVNHFFFLWI